MRPSSSAFSDGEAIPRRFTCDGDDVSPPLAWTDVPAGARSLALLCDDPTLRQALGTTGRSTIFQPIEPASPKAPATPKRGSSRPSMTFGIPATTAHARRGGMDRTIITFGCWRFPSLHLRCVRGATG
jgi:hypothetical protein